MKCQHIGTGSYGVKILYDAEKACNLSLSCNKAVNLNVEWSLLDVLSLIHKNWENMVLEKTLE